MAKTNRPKRIAKPTSLRGFTARAKGATFAQLTHGLGTGQKAPTTVTTYPFTGPNAATWASRTRNLDAQARAWVARALREPGVRSKISGNTGTVPELVVCGRYLSLHYRLGVTVFFQDRAFALKGFRLTKPFIADVAITAPGGTLILLPIDGHFFHARTLKQEIDSQVRNRALASLGKVIPIPDTECNSAARLNGFLSRHGAP